MMGPDQRLGDRMSELSASTTYIQEFRIYNICQFALGDKIMYKSQPVSELGGGQIQHRIPSGWRRHGAR